MTTSVNNSAANTVVIATVKAFDYGKIKGDFKAGKSIFTKVEKIKEKIAALNSELESLDQLLACRNSYCMAITGGYTPQDLITETVTPSGTFDKNGKEIMNYTYSPKEGIMRYNEDKKVYEIYNQEVALEEGLSSQNPPIVDEEAEVEMVKVEKEVETAIEESKEAKAEDAFGDAAENSNNNPFFA